MRSGASKRQTSNSCNEHYYKRVKPSADTSYSNATTILNEILQDHPLVVLILCPVPFHNYCIKLSEYL